MENAELNFTEPWLVITKSEEKFEEGTQSNFMWKKMVNICLERWHHSCLKHCECVKGNLDERNAVFIINREQNINFLFKKK